MKWRTTLKEGKLHKNGPDSVDYGSLMFGPTYRFNDYVSLYGNAGIATMKFNKHSKKTPLPTALA